jgi:hypothetical protein
MNHSIKPRVEATALCWAFCVLAIAALGLSIANLRGQSSFTNTPFTTSNSSMKQFVFFFRQSRQLSEPKQKQRTAEVVAWVQRQIAEGRKLEPRILGTERELVVEEENRSAAEPTSRGTLVATNFLEAKDFEEAVKIAKTHPGLRYGVSIEVRPWTNPLAPTNAPQSSNSGS